MARTIWKGALSFGLVNVPVGLYPATQDKAIHFNQLEEGTSDRIRYKKVNERTGKEVDNDQIVKGYDLGGGDYVILTDEELEAAEPETLSAHRHHRLRRPGRHRPDLLPHHLLPGTGGRSGREGLRAAPPGHARLEEDRHRDDRDAQQGVPGRHPSRRQRAQSRDDVLLRRDPLSRQGAAGAAELQAADQAREVSMAQQLIESMESEWDPSQYHDTHREKVEELIESKRQGNEVVVRIAEPEPTKVVDLMDVLSASIKSVKEGGNGRQRTPAVLASRTGTEEACPGRRRRRSGLRPGRRQPNPTSITAKSGDQDPA